MLTFFCFSSSSSFSAFSSTLAVTVSINSLTSFSIFSSTKISSKKKTKESNYLF
jgi:hypothetical protein